MPSSAKACLLGASTLVALACSQNASAVNAQSAPNAAAITPSMSANASAADGLKGGLDEIVVTAQRTASYASKTPVALSAITGSSLIAQGATNPTRLGDNVPNLSIVRNNGMQITIRGVSSSDNTEKGDPSVAFLLDGVYIARPQAQEVSFFDVNRVEVLRGPQGTLYGRNTTAGVVNVITNRPVDKFEAAGNIEVGNYSAVRGDAMINLPVNNILSLRFSGVYDRRDTYYALYPGDTAKLNPYKNNFSGRGQALFTFNPDISLLIRGDYSSIKGNGFALINATAYFAPVPASAPVYTNPLFIGNQTTFDARRNIGFPFRADPYGDSYTWGTDADLSWNLGPLIMSYLGSYREFKQDVGQTFNFGFPVELITAGKYKQVSQELRFATPDTGPLKLQFGGYYFRETSNNSLLFHNLVPGFAVSGSRTGPTKSESYGIFGQGTYSLTDDLRFTAGVRYSHDAKERQGISVLQRGPLPDPNTDIITPGDRAGQSTSKVTWRVGLDYDLNSKSLLYGSVATGYKGGSFNSGCEAGTPNCRNPLPASQLYYRPETLTAYEIGLKSRLIGNEMTLNVSAFYYDYRDLQVTSIVFDPETGNGGQLTYNAAKATVKGVEIESSITPSIRNRFDLGFTYLDAKYADYFPLGIGNPPDFKGQPLDHAPKYVARAGYTYTYPFANGGSLAFNARTTLTSEYVVTYQTLGRQFRQPDFTRTDLSLRFAAPDDRFYVQAFVQNLENNLIVTGITIFGRGTNVITDAPRTFGIRAGFKF